MKKSAVLLISLVILFFGCAPKKALPPPQPLGINGTVNALTVYNGNLVAAGSFSVAGTASANNIAQWNGSSWSSMGSGLNAAAAILITYKGNLIAGCPGTGIFKWNGNSWSQLISQNSSSYGFTIYDSNLVVTGVFDSIGGVKANNLAQWNGSVWSQIDTGSNSGILSVATYMGNLVVAGNYLVLMGNPYNGVAQWNGITWSELGTGLNTTYLENPIIYLNNSNLYMCSYNIFGVLNDTTWSIQVLGSTPFYANFITSFCSYNGKLITLWYQYGHGAPSADYYLQEWNGSSFNFLMDIPAVNTMIQYQNNLILAGGFSQIGNTPVQNIAQWNGSTWSAF
jgi:hypothetical protein